MKRMTTNQLESRPFTDRLYKSIKVAGLERFNRASLRVSDVWDPDARVLALRARRRESIGLRAFWEVHRDGLTERKL